MGNLKLRKKNDRTVEHEKKNDPVVDLGNQSVENPSNKMKKNWYKIKLQTTRSRQQHRF